MVPPQQRQHMAVQCNSDELNGSGWGDTAKPRGKNIAIHFVIECEAVQVSSAALVNVVVGSSEKQFLELVDTHVVLPVHLMVRDIANEAIQRLNISSDAMPNYVSYKFSEDQESFTACSGYIIMRHWKPLNVEYICDVSSTTLSELVGDFPNFVTLKIRFFRKASCFYESRDRLLALLSQAESLVRNESVLMSDERLVENGEKSENVNSSLLPLSNTTTRMGLHEAINLSIKRSNKEVISNDIRSPRSGLPFAQINNSHFEKISFLPGDKPGLQRDCSQSQQSLQPACSKMDSIVESLYNQRQWQQTNRRVTQLDNGNYILGNPTIPFVGSSIQPVPHNSVGLRKATRERVTFDQATELPVLLKTFEKTKHPSREQIESILAELTPLRKGKKPLEFFNIQYWFKNARAVCKRADANEEFCEDRGGSQPVSFPAITDTANDCLVNSSHEDSSQPIRSVDKPPLEPANVDSNGQDQVCGPNVASEEAQSDKMNGREVTADEMPVTNDVADGRRERYFFSDDHTCYHPSGMARFHCLYRASSFSNGSFAPAALDGIVSSSQSDVMNGKHKRNRVFIDPTTEIPILEKWFAVETHPTAALINTICDEINSGSYRQQYQKLKPRNIQLWFKNHRAKLKRVGCSNNGRHMSNSMLAGSPECLHSDSPLNLNSKCLDEQRCGCAYSNCAGRIPPSFATSPPLSPSSCDSNSEDSAILNREEVSNDERKSANYL